MSNREYKHLKRWFLASVLPLNFIVFSSRLLGHSPMPYFGVKSYLTSRTFGRYYHQCQFGAKPIYRAGFTALGRA